MKIKKIILVLLLMTTALSANELKMSFNDNNGQLQVDVGIEYVHNYNFITYEIDTHFNEGKSGVRKSFSINRDREIGNYQYFLFGKFVKDEYLNVDKTNIGIGVGYENYHIHRFKYKLSSALIWEKVRIKKSLRLKIGILIPHTRFAWSSKFSFVDHGEKSIVHDFKFLDLTTAFGINFKWYEENNKNHNINTLYWRLRL